VSSQAEIPERPCTSPDDLSECAEPQLTFRDPAGQLQLTRTHALRRIHPKAVEETLVFLASPLRAALERNGDLIPSEIVQSSIAQPGAASGVLPGELWLQHPRIDPISYPWEWTTAQWRSAAELTLRIASQAIDTGWTLKDATPLNILFVGARPILVDVLSLERRNPNSTTWLAYGQFVRTFLLPLLAEKLLNWPLQATLFFRDGYEPRTIYEALPPWQRLRPSLLDVVTLATLLEGKAGKADKTRHSPSTTDPELAAHILHKRISRLGRHIRRAARLETSSQWSGYQQSASHYQAADTEAKQEFVRGALERLRPAHVLDIGANTGVYSLMAAETGGKVVALDSDPAAIASLWRTAARHGHAVTALVANIARPTPAVGWRNREQLSLLDRLSGQFDLVLMLAVIHHLILREQVPLGHIGDLCFRLTRKWLLVEWVPPSDPMFQEWLRGRDEIYGHLTEADLTQAFAPFFAVSDRTVLGNGRILLLFGRKPEALTQREAVTA
jgi:SAM-dependent methyltransferase